MTKDEIIEMARKAGFQTGTRDYADGDGGHPFVVPIASGTCLPEIGRFAALVAEKEREACAKLCDEMEDQYWRSTEEQSNFTPVDCSDAIRARKP